MTRRTPFRFKGFHSPLAGLALMLALANLLTALPAAADDVAAVGVTDAAVTFQPIAAGPAGFTLTISGPGDFFHSENVAPGEAPSFSVFDAEGGVIPDGVYSYELRTAAELDLATRRAMQDSSERGLADRSGVQIPEGLYQQGFFSVRDGAFVLPAEEAAAETGGAAPQREIAERVVLTNANGVIRNSLCVGFDCADSPAFGDSTIILEENNLRIKFADTSINSFPSGDWEIEANSNLNGGQSYLGFNDCGSNDLQGSCANDLVFAVESGARASALYVESDGDVGVGTSNPVLEMHLVRGDSPGLRLQQDTSSGFAAQTWDVVGNETSFFIRDASNGSTLPFRIFPGSESNLLTINDDGVGVRDTTPDDYFDVQVGSANGGVLIESTTGNGLPQLTLIEDSGTWRFRVNSGGNFVFTDATSGTSPFQIDQGADNGLLDLNGSTVTVNGDLTVTGVKNFVMPDPTDASRAIYYAALEGPEAGTYFRGSAKITGGEAVIELPQVFSKITEAQGLTVQLTSVGGWHKLYVAEKSPERLVIRDAEGGDSIEFDYLVQGVRLGYGDYQADRPAPKSLQESLRK